jgi:uncharacterized protein (TIGR02284 family)
MEQDRSTSNKTNQAGRDAGSGSPQPRASPVSANLQTDYWRTNYQHRPYVEPGSTYEQYAPAYRYGAEMSAIHAVTGRSFDEVEPELGRNWDAYRGKSRLSWDKAKAAARDAWGRIERERSHPPVPAEPLSGPPADNTKIVPILRRLHRIAVDGAKGYRDAADHTSPRFTELLTRFAEEREAMDQDLRAQLALRGGEPDDSGDTLGALHRGWIDLKSVLTHSDKAIIDECQRGEEAAVKAYQDALNTQGLPPDLEILLNRHYSRVKLSHDQIAQLKRLLERE